MLHNTKINDEQVLLAFERPEPNRAGFALTVINSAVRSTGRMLRDFRYRDTARATSTAISGIASGLSMLTLLQIFPSIVPHAIIPILDVATGIMITSTGIAIMDLAGVKLFINSRLAAKAIASAFGAYVFTFDFQGSAYSDLSQLGHENDQQIDKTDFANYFNFALFSAVAATISVTHARVKYKNEQTRLAIAEGEARGLAEDELPEISPAYQAAENATNLILSASTIHAVIATAETQIENGKLNETSWVQLLRFGLSMSAATLMYGLNMIFKDKPARYINEFIGYLSSLDIITVFTLIVVNGVAAGEELSEVQQNIFMTTWPLMAMSPILFEASRVFYREVYSQRHNDVDIEAAESRFSDIGEESETESRFSVISDEFDSEQDEVIHVIPTKAERAEIDSYESEEDDEDTAPLAVANHHASLFTSVVNNKSSAGDLHIMTRHRR